MASLSTNYSAHTRGTTSFNRAQKKAHVLPAALRENQAYKKAYEQRTKAYNNLHTAREALKWARKRLKNHYDYESMDLAMREGQHHHKLSEEQKTSLDDIISDQLKNIPKHHSNFAAAHEEMRAMEHKAVAAGNLKSGHRLARTSTFPNRGQMYGKFGIYNINASHIAEKDKMEPVEGDHQDYMKGGRRKKTRKKRRRKNKRKTKRRKKTRRRKKRRKKRRTKRR
tara:strand:+ start:37 stop:711 length:675 start_codon:yes stop_codon:yes gene_type:complete